MVVEVFPDDNIEHCKSHSRVSAWTKLQMIGSTGAEPSQAGVDGDNLATALHQVNDSVPIEAIGIGLKRALAPQDDVLRKLVFGVIVAILEKLSIVKLGIARAQKEVGDNRAGTVARRSGHHERDIRSLEARVGQRGTVDARLTSGTLRHEDGFRSIVVPNLMDFVVDDVESLVPGDALPLVLAAILFGTPHRIENAVGAVLELDEVHAPCAKAALGDGVLLVTLDLDYLPILDMKNHATPSGMASRRRPATSPDQGFPVFLGLPTFLHFLSSL